MATTYPSGRDTIFTSFADPGFAEKAAGALLDYGVDQNDLSLVSNRTTTMEPPRYPDRADLQAGEANREKRAEEHERKEDHEDLAAKSGISTTTPRDAAQGAAVGGAIGLGVGALAAIGSILVPGFGLVAGG